MPEVPPTINKRFFIISIFIKYKQRIWRMSEDSNPMDCSMIRFPGVRPHLLGKLIHKLASGGGYRTLRMSQTGHDRLTRIFSILLRVMTPIGRNYARPAQVEHRKGFEPQVLTHPPGFAVPAVQPVQFGSGSRIRTDDLQIMSLAS